MQTPANQSAVEAQLGLSRFPLVLQDPPQSPQGLRGAPARTPGTQQRDVLHQRHRPIAGGGRGQGRQADRRPQARYGGADAAALLHCTAVNLRS